VNGDATGRETAWCGLESLFKVNATPKSVTYSSGVGRSANQADIAGYPEGTYAGIEMTLGNYGGENESGQYWPYGVADAEYDFWTPLICLVDTTHTDLPSSTNTFAGQGDEALRWGIIHGQRNSGVDGQITNIMLSRDYYMAMLNLMDNKEQINITGENSLRAMGFKNVFTFDGIEVSWEAAIKSGTGYGFNYANIELMGMDDVLLKPEGPEYDIHSQSFNAVVSTLSNFRYRSPRCFIKWCGYANMADNQT
jgi:hypothetical protein